MRVIRTLCLAWLIIFLLSSASFADSQYDGWWFAPEYSGSGLSLAINGDTIFAAIYTYNPEGKPVWFTMSAQKAQDSPLIFSGDLIYWQNGTQDFMPNNPQPHKAGTMSLELITPDSARLTYQITDFGTDTMTLDVVKFMPTIAPGDPDLRLKGWWYDPNSEGMGVFLEAQGGTLFGAWYHYMMDEQSNYAAPSWTSFSGAFSSGATTFVGPLFHWDGGSILGMQPYVEPKPFDTGYSVTLNINDDGTIDAGVGPKNEAPIFWIKLTRFTF
ncbi:MAG: hypothetical protein GXO58_02475 [Thermodesulfobacteria bacterium]|nr:hypothetical protein [Thermodesulfobacteriota bacterium]